MTSKKKVEYPPSKLKRVDLENNWYCNITDNEKTDAEFTVFTIHGAPGDHR